MSQKTDTMIKLALVFTISLLSFSIGTYVGKMYSDNQHKLALLEPQAHPAGDNHEFATTEVGGEKQAATNAPAVKETTLTDSEVAKIAEEFATDETESSTDEKPITTTQDEKTIPTVSSAAVRAALKPAKSAPAAKVSETERVPASIPKRDSSMHFTVQAGSFPTAEEAQKLTKELQSKGFKTSAVPAQVNGQTWYRVNVGLFGSVKEAQDYRKDFLEKSKLSSAFVQKVQQ